MKITWLGHSGFRIEIETAVLLVDPWLTGNPMFPADQRAAALKGATYVLLTHGHGDHAGDAFSIAKELNIPLVGIYDLMSWYGKRDGLSVIGFNKGGTVDLGGAKVTLVNASHSSSVGGDNGAPIYAGSEAGFMIAGDGHTIYISGDTDIMADMEWMADLHKPDIGILSAGGHYTMDMARAAYAAKRYFNFKTVIPCHYRTFPVLAQTAEVLAAGLPGVKVIEPQVMQPIIL
jgi:L-ascorbate metabolism protein UlaG (beta-lactamase superfamily)